MGLAVLDEGGDGAESNEELRRLYHTNDDEQADTNPKATDVTPTPEPEAARFSVDYSRGEVLLESSDESDDDDEEGQESVRTACAVCSLPVTLSHHVAPLPPLPPPPPPPPQTAKEGVCTGAAAATRARFPLNYPAYILVRPAQPSCFCCVYIARLTSWPLWPASLVTAPCQRTRN